MSPLTAWVFVGVVTAGLFIFWRVLHLSFALIEKARRKIEAEDAQAPKGTVT